MAMTRTWPPRISLILRHARGPPDAVDHGMVKMLDVLHLRLSLMIFCGDHSRVAASASYRLTVPSDVWTSEPYNVVILLMFDHPPG